MPAVAAAPVREARVLHVGDDERAEAAGVGQGAGEDAGVLRPRGRRRVKATAPASRRKAISVISRPSRPLVSAAMRQDADRGVGGGAAGHELEDLGGVDGGDGVGAGDDGGDAPGGGGAAGGAERFLVALAGLGDLDAPVDDAGREAGAAAVDHRGEAVERVGGGGEEVGDEAVLDRRGRRARSVPASGSIRTTFSISVAPDTTPPPCPAPAPYAPGGAGRQASGPAGGGPGTGAARVTPRAAAGPA